MRLWSLDPALLDRRALVAGWRETLLAQKVLRGETKGYTRHPQLERFRDRPDPLQAIADYLHAIADEADRRGYSFDRGRISRARSADPDIMYVTSGQLNYELAFLQSKVAGRDPEWGHTHLDDTMTAEPHPLFAVVDGPIETWERVKPAAE
ncbi:DNA lyase [Kocuria sp. cx-455]|uniref:pyrimidine dimer DNA glycosylase/endonuclease V n=1 Tax=Kocuria sp. cx-455 TaxID=2771377 RepID=UPI0016872C22|nr:pyrimidine dimer DNA glycosylase/endonuclease V [Kocuria sp. cx-455]MBD2765844.1 DNA lyase [Kocuria sp. cx-455]